MIQTIIVDDELLAGVGVQSLIDGKEDICVAGVFNMPQDALEFLKDHFVDIVITDIEMADMNGLEFIRLIRKEHLAAGVIILSCHDDFAYAQEAISSGTDSYLLKHSISSKCLLEEIHKVYAKTSFQERSGELRSPKEETVTGNEAYTLGVLRIDLPEHASLEKEQHVEGTMLAHLLEGLVSRFEMGTLFSPYNKDIFIIFKDDQRTGPQKRRENLMTNISIIMRTLQQYIDGKVRFGLSCEFYDLQQVQDKYAEAETAVEMWFYTPSQPVFDYQEPLLDFRPAPFTTGIFFEDEGPAVFQRELSAYLKKAKAQKIPVKDLRNRLLRDIDHMIYQIQQEHRFSEEMLKRWNFDSRQSSIIMQGSCAEKVEETLTEMMKCLRCDVLRDMEGDGIQEVLDYIEQHLSDKLTLTELAELGYMSVPTFSKKFKEKTGITPVQYLNERRIERAKLLLRNSDCSLEQIAEETGFSNANYLIRVFKKVTGQTISRYRKF